MELGSRVSREPPAGQLLKRPSARTAVWDPLEHRRHVSARSYRSSAFASWPKPPTAKKAPITTVDVCTKKMKNERVKHPSDVVSEGQEVYVKLLGFDDRGKVRLSMKVVDQETGEEAKQEEAEQAE